MDTEKLLRFNGVLLEQPCKRCQGEGVLDGKICWDCYQTGVILTKEGKILVDLLGKYGR